MRKWWIFVFLVLNAILFAHWQSWLDLGLEDKREPERVFKQINPKEIVTQAETVAAQEAIKANPPQTPASVPFVEPTSKSASVAPGLACLQFLPLAQAESDALKRVVQEIVNPLKIDEQRQEAFPSFLVYLPPADSLRAAQRKVADLTRVGVDETFIIPDGSLKWAISLGLFRSRDGAEKLTQALAERKIVNARIQPRVIANVTILSVNGLNTTQAAAIAALAQRGPDWASAPCKS